MKKEDIRRVDRKFLLSFTTKAKTGIKLAKNNWMLLLGLFICFIIIFLYSMSAGHYVNFNPINGTFQNYNPVRRFFSGQIPYRDFQDYLGLGHLYIGSLATYLFGNSYQSSLVAFTFLTMLSFAMIVFVIAKIFFKKNDIAIALTNIVLVLLIMDPPIWRNTLVILDDIYVAMKSARGVGTSARFVRGMILPISCVMLWFIKIF